MASEAKVIGTSKDMVIGKRKASMPMKCMAQIPVPMHSAPAASQVLANPGFAAADTRAAKSRAL